MKKKPVERIKAAANNAKNHLRNSIEIIKHKINTAHAKQSMKQYRERWHKTAVSPEIADLKGIKNWPARRAALKEQRESVRNQHVLWDLHQSRTPNLGERMNYFAQHLDPLIKVKGKDGKKHYGGKLMQKIYSQYNKTGTTDPIPRELEGMTLNRALAISFLSLVESKKMPHKVGKDLRVKNGFRKKLTERKIKKIVEKMYNSGQISFKGQTKIKFEKENIASMVKILGRQETGIFMKSLRRNVSQETGGIRWHLESIVDPTHVLNKWDMALDRKEK